MKKKIQRYKATYRDKKGMVWTESDAVIEYPGYILRTSDNAILGLGSPIGAAVARNIPGKYLMVVAASSTLGLIGVPTHNQYKTYKVSLILPLLEAIRVKKEQEDWSNSLLNTNFIPIFWR
jgi:hypothetical protein